MNTGETPREEIEVIPQGPTIIRNQPCPNCYGGHFRPCQWCCDSGLVDLIPKSPASAE